MSEEQLSDQVADLKRQVAALSQELTAAKSERERLVAMLEGLLPIPTEEEMAELIANGPRLSDLIDQIAAECGVPRHGR